jgi:hypothetical protein
MKNTAALEEVGVSKDLKPETPMIGTPRSKKTRNLHIREVANGYVLRLEVQNPRIAEMDDRYMEQELVVTNLQHLLKKVKTFFQAEIVEKEEDTVTAEDD